MAGLPNWRPLVGNRVKHKFDNGSQPSLALYIIIRSEDIDKIAHSDCQCQRELWAVSNKLKERTMREEEYVSIGRQTIVKFVYGNFVRECKLWESKLISLGISGELETLETCDWWDWCVDDGTIDWSAISGRLDRNTNRYIDCGSFSTILPRKLNYLVQQLLIIRQSYIIFTRTGSYLNKKIWKKCKLAPDWPQ